MRGEYLLYINGAWIASGHVAEIRDVADGSLVTRVHMAGAKEAEAALAAAEAARESWGKTMPDLREKLLLRAAEIFERREEELTELLIRESGSCRYKARGEVVPGAPKRPGKNALIFCTYCGTHTGMNEAVPAGKYLGQFFEHFGFTVADEWYILSEYVGNEPNNTLGRMGDVRGLPNEADMVRLRTAAKNLAGRL